MTIDLLDRARAGDRAAFADLVAPHRAELRAHCYRMLGSFEDAEDALQDTLLAAWLGLAGFEGRSSVRTWLYRVATNRCLNALRSASRRPVTASPLPATPPQPTRYGEVFWLQPYPDDLLDDLVSEVPGPEARYESREAISLAFVAAVQLLPANQRAVLLLRDVLGYRASETAQLLGLTEDAVTSALKRARATVSSAHPDVAAPPAGSARENELADRFVAAFMALDVEALVSLLTEDAWVKMPPLPFEYRGRVAAREFFLAIHAQRRRELCRMVPVRANGRPAWGAYARDAVTGAARLNGLITMDAAHEGITELIRFEPATATFFGLPRTLAC